MLVEDMSIMEVSAVRKSGWCGRRHPVLLGIGLILCVILGTCFVRSDSSFSTSVRAISPVPERIENSSIGPVPTAQDNNLRFDERVRATEAGFIAAFPFHR